MVSYVEFVIFHYKWCVIWGGSHQVKGKLTICPYQKPKGVSFEGEFCDKWDVSSMTFVLEALGFLKASTAKPHRAYPHLSLLRFQRREEDDRRQESPDTDFSFKSSDLLNHDLWSHKDASRHSHSPAYVRDWTVYHLIGTRLYIWTDLNLYINLELWYYLVFQMDASQGVWHSRKANCRQLSHGGGFWKWIWTHLPCLMSSDYMKNVFSKFAPMIINWKFLPDFGIRYLRRTPPLMLL